MLAVATRVAALTLVWVAIPASAARAAGPADTPLASFTITPVPAFAGQTVTFDGSASHDPDGDAIVSYAWTFGDGAAATTSSPRATHVYAAKGTYKVTLIVTDSHGSASAQLAQSLTVKTVHYNIPDEPTAQFTFSPSVGTIGQPVRFDGSGSFDADGDTIVAYEWKFGDHTSVTTSGPTVEHTYQRAAVVTVRLVVVDSRGAKSDAVDRALQVGTPPPPRLTQLHLRVCTRRAAHCPRRGLRVRFALSEAATVVLTVRRRNHRRTLRRVVIGGRAGANKVAFRFIGRRGRHYVLRARPVGGQSARKPFVWRRR